MANADPVYGMRLTCCDCGDSFIFTAGEQRYFAKNGLHIPRRCKPCRAANSSQSKEIVRRGGVRSRDQRDREEIGDGAMTAKPDPRRQGMIDYLVTCIRKRETTRYRQAFVARLRELSDADLQAIYQSARAEQGRRDLAREDRRKEPRIP